MTRIAQEYLATKKPNGLFESVRRYIEENGPVMSRDIYGKVPFTDSSIRTAIHALHKIHGLVHIARWSRIRNATGADYKSMALYMIGSGEDAPKPERLSMKVSRRRHRAKKRTQYIVNSVFSLGANLDDRRTTLRKRPDMAGKRQKQPVAHPG